MCTFSSLIEVMDTLRSEKGCPWDREQTLESLREYLIEESYEVLDKIHRSDFHGLMEELGDLLFEFSGKANSIPLTRFQSTGIKSRRRRKTKDTILFSVACRRTFRLFSAHSN
jgi:hypothetical protein